MINDKHYSPMLNVRLKNLLATGDYEALTTYLDTLSNSNFRTAGYMIGERFMPAMEPADFWALFAVLLRYNAKAFLVTMLKALTDKLSQGTFDIRDSALVDVLRLIADNETDTQKTLQNVLPVLDHPSDVEFLFEVLAVDSPSSRVAYLLRVPTMPCYYVLLRTLHYLEHERPFLIRTAHYLMKSGDKHAFNMASLLRSVYGLEEVKGTFSLQLQPYQISRIEANYDAFCEAIK